MYLSVRAIGRRLGVSREQAQTLCDAGLCGAALQTSGGPRYDEAIVDALARRHFVTSVQEVGPPVDTTGIFVSRPGAWTPTNDPDRPGMGYSVTKAGTEDQIKALDRRWIGAASTEDRIRTAIENCGGQPYVATVGGFVVETLLIKEVYPEPGGLRFDLVPARAQWAANLHERRLNSGSGGPWVWWPRSNKLP